MICPLPKPFPGSSRWTFMLCLSLLNFRQAGAQVNDFSPAVQDAATLANLSTRYQQRYKDELDKLPSKNKKDLVEVYQHRWENIKEKFDKKEIYTSSTAQEYLNRLVAAIRQGNP